MSLRTKLANIIAGKKAYDLDVSTPRGNLFFNLTDNELGKFMNAVWGQYSDSSLINLYHTMAEIYAPVYQRASRVAQGLWQVKKLENDEVVYDSKDLNRLMESPNPLQNFQELIYEWVAMKCVTGKNYLYSNVPDTMTFRYQNIAALWNLPADIVTIRTNSRIKLLSATQLSDLVEAFDVSVGNSSVKLCFSSCKGQS